MKTVHSVSGIQRLAETWRKAGATVGFVPTMGALHAGHLALIRRARRECACVVVSIYVNPTQFGPGEDLARYPRPRARDLALCREAGVDFVFAPGNLYRPDHSTWVEELALSQGRDGASRPGHFRGVATVVLKLFNLVRPTRAYFGQKDAQQVDVIQRMVRDLDLPLRIVVVPTVRDSDGVALSSRNAYLSQEERLIARDFAAALREAARSSRPARRLETALKRMPKIKVDYVAATEDRLSAAVIVGKTRLIDNRALKKRAGASLDGDGSR